VWLWWPRHPPKSNAARPAGGALRFRFARRFVVSCLAHRVLPVLDERIIVARRVAIADLGPAGIGVGCHTLLGVPNRSLAVHAIVCTDCRSCFSEMCATSWAMALSVRPADASGLSTITFVHQPKWLHPLPSGHKAPAHIE
jgi:hypothetical protein